MCANGVIVLFSFLSDMEHNFQQDLPEEMPIYSGEDGVLNCLPPEANPPVTEWAWFKGLSRTTRLQSISGKITMNNSQLIVHNTTFEDGGFYSCIVSNGNFSRSSRDSHLTVQIRPRKLFQPIMVYIRA